MVSMKRKVILVDSIGARWWDNDSNVYLSNGYQRYLMMSNSYKGIRTFHTGGMK